MQHQADIPRQPRRDRLLRERVHDPYKMRRKLPEPTVCPQCGTVFHEGRWHWVPRPQGVHEERCQACHWINDGYPAGEVSIGGGFGARHNEEIIQLARHQEEREKLEHPLHRIMTITEQDGAILVRTTDVDLPRRIGGALRHAYGGDLDFPYNDEPYAIRIRWARDN